MFAHTLPFLSVSTEVASPWALSILLQVRSTVSLPLLEDPWLSWNLGMLGISSWFLRDWVDFRALGTLPDFHCLEQGD